MVTIYRRGQAIARCERAEVLAGLRSGRFELTDHYESPETDGWISLTHFESRAYERQPRMVFLYTPGHTVDTDQGLVPLEGESPTEKVRQRYPFDLRICWDFPPPNSIGLILSNPVPNRGYSLCAI